MDLLPPIEVNQDRILIDGYHRWKGHETAKRDTIRCIVTKTGSDVEIQQLAVARNGSHGLQLSREDKKKLAISWWQVMPDTGIISTLSISERTFREWTAAKRQAHEEQQKQRVVRLIVCAPHIPPRPMSDGHQGSP